MIPRDLHVEAVRQRHLAFDWLSGSAADTRTPDDLIREEVFASLENRLKRLDGLIEHVNVHVAHAATEFSRTGRVLEGWSLDDAKQAIKELAEVAQFAGEWFCHSGVGTILPHPQFDVFAHIDQPFFAGDTQPLYETWSRLEREIEDWCRVEPTEL